jgi:primosomal protein N' (replication factor Y)
MFCEIVFPIPLHKKYIYSLPQQIVESFSVNEEKKLVGYRAIVDFGNQKNVVGVIVNIKKETNFDKNIKPVKNVVDPEPLFSKEQLEFAEQLVDKYLVPLGLVLYQFFPYDEKVKFEQGVIATQEKKVSLKVDEKYINFCKNKKLLVFSDINEKFLFYINVVFDVINKDRQLIVLFPSNEYLVDFWKFLLKNVDDKSAIWLKSKIMLYTGELPVTERYKVWHLVKNKRINIILATRIGAFLPFENVTNIIIDEADSLGYRNQEVPMYHACDIVKERIKNYRILLNYTSFVPSVVLYFKNKKNVKFIKSDSNLTEIAIVKGKLKKIILENIYKFKQTVIVFPYKGYARYCVCTLCKHRVPIKKITVERFICPKCGSKYYELKGTGIQKFIQKLYDVDKSLTIEYIDSTLNEKKIEKIIDRFNNEKIDVLVATPLLFNYLYRISFANVKSVYFSCLDSLIYSGSYLSYENVFKLVALCRVLFSSYKNKGEIYLEIFHQKEYDEILLSELKTFYEKELEIRKELCFPPFSEIVKIVVVSKEKNKIERILSMFKEIKFVYLVKDIINENNLYKGEILIRLEKNFDTQIRQIKNLVLPQMDFRYDKIYIEYNPVL